MLAPPPGPDAPRAEPAAGPTPPPQSARRRRLFLVCWVGLVALLSLAGVEGCLRWRGVRPYRPAPLDIRVEPGGRFMAAHPDGLGYAHLPGRFTVTLPSGYSFRVTHDTNGLRVTHPPRSAGDAQPPKEIWIFGCSLTHGWALNDEETYPWRVQAALPEYEVVNAGVGGYSTLQARLLFQEMLGRRPTPEVVVLAYGTFHDLRNTFVRERQKMLAPYNRLGPVTMPYARFNGRGELDYYPAPLEYREFPLMRVLASAHYVEEKYDAWEARRARSREVSAELILRFAGYCREQGIRFVLAGISSDAGPMLEFCRRRGVAAVDISVVLAEPGNTNLPHDNHPSAQANRVYAEKLTAFLKSQVFAPPAGRGAASNPPGP